MSVGVSLVASIGVFSASGVPVVAVTGTFSTGPSMPTLTLALTMLTFIIATLDDSDLIRDRLRQTLRVRRLGQVLRGGRLLSL